jgi:transcriptional regulator GlxA family with amidase domain
MNIAFIIYDDITWLDLVGVYDPVSRLKGLDYLPDLRWDFCAFTETASDRGGFRVLPGKVGESLAGYDAIIVPGGWGTTALMEDAAFMDWLKTASPSALKISVCTGSLLLGKAGFLQGHKATTHFDYYDTLRPFCREVVQERVVHDGNCITAGAVSSSLDLGLYLCRQWVGDDADIMVRYKMDYRG